MTQQQKKRFPTGRSLIWYFLEGSKRWFALSILCAGVTSLLDLVSPKLISYTVDSVIGGEASDLTGMAQNIERMLGGSAYLRRNLWMIPAAVIMIAVLANMFRYLNKLTNSIGAEHLLKRMRDQLFGHIERLPFAWHGQNHTGDIIQRCTSDVETIKNFVADQLTSLFRIVILMACALWFMWGIHPGLTLLSAAFFPVIVLYSLFFHARIGDAFEHADEEEGKLSAIAQENLTGVRVVRAFGREIYERERFERQNTSYTYMWIRLMKLLSAFWGSSDLISGLQVMAVTIVGAVFCVKGQLTAGQYIAFISYNAMLTWPVRSLGRVIADLSKAGISIDRLCYIMNAQEEADREDALTPPMNRDIAFEHVSYRYARAEKTAENEKAGGGKTAGAVGRVETGSDRKEMAAPAAEVLQDVSFMIKAGTTVGILGGTGSGKSTLMYLLDRLYELPKEMGRITIGGVDIADIKRDYLRQNIGMVLQEPFLFSRTLEENIAITLEDEQGRKATTGDGDTSGKSAARDHRHLEEVRRAAQIASLDETIQHFGKGYDTYVGERGVTLSGGQKQRTAIAQMLIRKPPIMIFDDSLSAVDAETDSRIRHALKENSGDSTVILIAHRITTLMHADQILVLDKGRVAEQGTHEELLEQKGIYRRIYDLQVRQSEIGA